MHSGLWTPNRTRDRPHRAHGDAGSDCYGGEISGVNERETGLVRMRWPKRKMDLYPKTVLPSAGILKYSNSIIVERI